jgi:hypothetical protein
MPLAYVQIYLRKLLVFELQEDLHNTTVPINTFRTEMDLKAPFENNGEELGLQLLQIKTRPIKFYENSKCINIDYSLIWFPFQYMHLL